MKITLEHDGREYLVDLSKPLDISISLRASEKNPLAWYVGPPTIEPVRLGPWIGSVEQGGSVNFNQIGFAPHAHGTHTECVGHITKEFESVDRRLDRYFFVAEVLTVAPETFGDDLVISPKQLKSRLKNKHIQALVLRTLPNTSGKKKRHYDHTNWPYLLPETAAYIRELGIEHLLVDLPSVDKEEDGGALQAHREFWNYPAATRYNATITELIYVRNAIQDGTYLLNMQVAPFDNNASPSRPLLFALDG
jgi:kynurenine formamidase